MFKTVKRRINVKRNLLLFGALAGVVFFVAIYVLAPLVTAIAWRRHDVARSIVVISWLVAVLVFASIFHNISPAFNRDLYPLEYYGIVQRSAFVLIYGWFAWIGFWCLHPNTEQGYLLLKE